MPNLDILKRFKIQILFSLLPKSLFQTSKLKHYLNFTSVSLQCFHCYVQIAQVHTIINEKSCSRSLSSSGSFAAAAFPSHTHYSHTHKSLRASGASVMLLCCPGALSPCPAAAHSQHSEQHTGKDFSECHWPSKCPLVSLKAQ